MENTSKLSVYYDGGCPLCVSEIGFYQRRKGAGDIGWIDVSQAIDEQITPDLSRCDALSRFHVRDQQGTLYSGAAAFTQIWTVLPGFRLLAAIATIPPLPWILEGLYRLFLIFRPRMQRLVRRFGNHGLR